MNCTDRENMCVTMIVFGVMSFCLCGCVCCMIFSRVMNWLEPERPTPSNTEIVNPLATERPMTVVCKKPVFEDEDPIAEP
jgi:hypothetical protein